MLSGSVQTSKYKAASGTSWWAVLNWTATQDKVNNESTVAWEVVTDTDANSSYVKYSELRVKIDGSEEHYTSSSTHVNGYKGTVLAQGSKVIKHNQDGSRHVTISLEAGVYVHAINCSGSKTFELDPIPRESVVSATDANVDATSMLVINKQNDAYTHSIKYTFGSVSGYVTAAGGSSSSEVKFSQTSLGFKVPTTFYNQMTSTKSKVCTLTCTTYSGSTKIGETTTTEFTVTVSDASAPTVSGTIVDVNTTSKNLTGNANKLIRFVSTARCTITATAKNSATITEKKINGQTVTGTTLDIANVEFNKIPFYAKDSRGFETTVEVEASMVPYIVLTCNSRVARTDQAAGKAKIYIDGNYYKGSFGSQSNTLTVAVSYKSGSSTVNVSVSPVIGSDGEYSVEKEISDLDYAQTYTFTITVSDKVSIITKTVLVGRGTPVFDWGQNDFYINVPLYMEGNRILNVGTPVDNEDAVPLGYVKRNISATANGTLAIGSTFKLSESIIGQNPIFATLAYAQTMGRVSGSTGSRSISFYNVTGATNGVYINMATFNVTDDGLTLTLNSTKQILIKSDGIVANSGVSFHFGEVILII